ncbi:MAG TPA: M24 family metallopeptidase [Thermodesulfobacteriota bacterium]|nr:M24 family metallopeptidase [Thermodesulfobacteriota bacterium]
MAFSGTELKRRRKAIHRILETRELRALILFGDTNVGSDVLGDFRYFVDNRTIAGRQVAMLFPQREPVLLVGSAIQRQAAERRSSIGDCRLSDNMPADMVKLLQEQNVLNGRVGVNFEVLPVNWYHYLRKELSEIDWVETHEDILSVRLHHVPEEADLFRKCAALGDGSYEAALKTIRPGVSEYEIAAAIEASARARGAEQHFTLVGSGKFALGDQNGLPLPYSPSMRRVENGDSVVMEISPCLEGYWTQIVRTVNVGSPNAELEKLYRVSRDAIKKTLEVFKPGKTIRDLVAAMDALIKSCGYLPKPPYGHVCGVDLIDARVSPQNGQVLDPGTAVILHPTVFTPDHKNSFFWGETYLVTDDGYERLHHASDELMTLIL